MPTSNPGICPQTNRASDLCGESEPWGWADCTKGVLGAPGTRLCQPHPIGAPSCFNVYVGLGREGRKSGCASVRKKDAGWLNESLHFQKEVLEGSEGRGSKMVILPSRVCLRVKLMQDRVAGEKQTFRVSFK